MCKRDPFNQADVIGKQNDRPPNDDRVDAIVRAEEYERLHGKLCRHSFTENYPTTQQPANYFTRFWIFSCDYDLFCPFGYDIPFLNYQHDRAK